VTEEKMEGSCSTGQSPQWAVVPVEEEEEEEVYVLYVSQNIQRLYPYAALTDWCL
jgi:hypothetical protein